MHRVNFFPIYEELLRSKEKTTTFRLGARTNDYVVGTQLLLTVGWTETEAKQLHSVRVRAVYSKKVGALSNDDFVGESPDCQTVASTVLVLGAIYRTVVHLDDTVTVVKFEHL